MPALNCRWLRKIAVPPAPTWAGSTWATLLLSVFCVLVTTPARAADELLTQLAQQFEKRPVLRAEFVQSKAMAAFKKPLMTRGRLVFVRGKGVLWQIEAPLSLSYVLTDERIVEIAADGTKQTRSAQDLPGLAQVSRIFRALLGAQTSALQDVFTSKAEGKLEAWQLTLQPKPSPVGQFMRQITLEGGRYVECIRIEEGNGDVTTISFRNSTEAAMPSAEELARLDSR